MIKKLKTRNDQYKLPRHLKALQTNTVAFFKIFHNNYLILQEEPIIYKYNNLKLNTAGKKTVTNKIV